MPGSIRSPGSRSASGPQQIRLRSTVKDERLARIELGRLLKETSDGRRPETDATVARLMDEYAAVAGWGLSTREANEGYIRRTIKPALGHLQVRKVRGPILDKLYMRLMRCGQHWWPESGLVGTRSRLVAPEAVGRQRA